MDKNYSKARRGVKLYLDHLNVFTSKYVTWLYNELFLSFTIHNIQILIKEGNKNLFSARLVKSLFSFGYLLYKYIFHKISFREF
jgi:hypothetical protein